MVDTAIVDHLPSVYEDALHALYGNGLPEQGDEDAKILKVSSNRASEPAKQA